MSPGTRARPTAVALVAALATAPALTGCGLFEGGSTLEDALEVLPADTFRVEFTDRARMAERLELDDIDPRDLSDADFEEYVEGLEEVGWGSPWVSYLALMQDAPVNELDVQWSAFAQWGAPDDVGSAADVFKVGDDVDFDALADDLTDIGYDDSESDGRLTFSIDRSAIEVDGTIGGRYPPSMLNVLLDEDERLVVTALAPESLEAVTDVITDDADSLVDDGGFEELADVAEEDPEHASMARGDAACPARGDPPATEEHDDLGRPDAKALLVSGDEPDVVIALQFADSDAAEDDLAAREDLVDDGADPITLRPFAELGDFEVERDGDLVIVTTDFDDGPRIAAQAERNGGGPGYCP